ncbi:MAG: Zn-dependent hydrolase [Acidaminococcaceae bacterium]|jgi:N-carbamoyl-L-amino-acid hydrolase|nr:Zn-dependent hydrolase [Acidaminococcaceae bacterium]
MAKDVVEILKEIGKVGLNADGSYTRNAYSKEFFQAVDVIKGFMQELGMKITTDAAGNVLGVLPGNKPELKHIIMGSHLDTVEKGGLYDGAYGVTGALAALFALKEKNIKLNHTVEVYGFNGEEDALGGTFGSRAVTGLIAADNKLLNEGIQTYGHTVEEILACKRDLKNAKCYLELHIEQGERLDEKKINIGVVSGIVGIVRYKVVAHGTSNHAGSTQMFRRKDALVGMSKLIVKGNELCKKIDPDMVFTVGTITCAPGAKNVIPGRVECCFEMRQLEKAKTDALIAAIKAAAPEITDCDFTFEPEMYAPGVLCNPKIMETLQTVAKTNSLSYAVMPSGAGHDAESMGHHIPIGMIFVPSKDGFSHCKEEWTSDKDLQNGVKVMSGALELLDKEA